MSSAHTPNDRDDLLEDILREYAETHPDGSVRESTPASQKAQEVDAEVQSVLMPPTEEEDEGGTVAVSSCPLLGEELLEEEHTAEVQRARRRSPVCRFFCKESALWRFLEWFAPKRGDAVPELVRKLCFLVAICVLLGSVTYLVNDTFLIPYSNTLTVDSVGTLYTPGVPPVLTPEEENFTGYPEGISDDFKKLYYANNDVRGWINYPSTSEYWYGIDYPIVQSRDNDFYLYRDFYKTDNKNGTLFFDFRNDFSSADAKNKMTIVYGHNMRSGQMFASLNRLVFNLGFARSAPVVYMNTLYEAAQYKVFAVFVMDEGEPDRWNYLRTEFDDYTMAQYLEEVKLRTMYFYDDVEVDVSDEFLLLYTCGNTSQNELKDGRTIVLARRLREGETVSTDTSMIRNNPDPLMPKAWYTAQGKELPFYYTGIEPGSTTTTTPDGEGETTTTVAPDGEGETTTTVAPDGEGETTTTVAPDGEGETTTTVAPDGEGEATTSAPVGETTTTTVVIPEGGGEDATTTVNTTTTTEGIACDSEPATTTTTTAAAVPQG